MHERLTGPLQRQQGGAGQQVRWAVRRIQADRGAKFGQRGCRTVALMQHDAEIVMHEAQIAAGAQDVPERFVCGVEPALLECGDALRKTLRLFWGQARRGRGLRGKRGLCC